MIAVTPLFTKATTLLNEADVQADLAVNSVHADGRGLIHCRTRSGQRLTVLDGYEPVEGEPLWGVIYASDDERTIVRKLTREGQTHDSDAWLKAASEHEQRVRN